MDRYFAYSGRVTVVVKFTDEELEGVEHPTDAALERAHFALKSGPDATVDADIDFDAECDQYGCPKGNTYVRG